MSKYFEGYYCKDDDSINGIKNKNEREVLRAIDSSYPWGITREEISKLTSISQDTVYNSLKTLGRIGYLKKEEKMSNLSKGSHGQRDAFTYYTENQSYAVNNAQGFSYQFAPGSTRYSNDFVESWPQLVEKDLQDNVYALLLNLVRRVFTIIEGSNDKVIKSIAPKRESTKNGQTSKMHCRYCGINHEARDFIRAILLHLIDQFEISQGLIEFLNSQKLITPEAYEQCQKVSKIQEEEEEVLQWFKELGREKRRVMELLFKPQLKASGIDKMIKLKSIADSEGVKDLLDDAKEVFDIDVGFKRMFENILKYRPDITDGQLREMIDKKKRELGNDNLTDEGALLLVGYIDLDIPFPLE